MADLNSLIGEPETADSTTWPQVRAAAARWTSAQLAEQIQRTGPALRDDLHPDAPESDLDLLPDFEAEP